MTCLPKEIGELKRLKELNLQGNDLEVLPQELGQLELLTQENSYCKLAGNPLIEDLVKVLQKNLKIAFEYLKSDAYKYVMEAHL